MAVDLSGRVLDSLGHAVLRTPFRGGHSIDLNVGRL
jgi:hypothetical protein